MVASIGRIQRMQSHPLWGAGMGFAKVGLYRVLVAYC